MHLPVQVIMGGAGTSCLAIYTHAWLGSELGIPFEALQSYRRSGRPGCGLQFGGGT